MTASSVGAAGMVVLFVLLALRVPVAFAMFAVGFVGIWLLNGLNAATSLLASEAFTLASSPELVVIPLFILMGNIASQTGMSRQLYDAAYAVIGSVRGGLASATVIGCGGFAALSGSSVASALTMGKVALAEMDRYKYDSRLSTGVVAAGGTLGILIPPSTGFVIYAILTEQSIGRLFLAGVLPGILLLSLFVLAVTLLCYFRPQFGPAGPPTAMAVKLRAIGRAGPIVAVIVLTIGGIYGGLFSPVEAAAVGAGAVIVIGAVLRTLSVPMLWVAARESVVTTATVMLILIAAHLINPFLALSHIPDAVGGLVDAIDLGPTGVLLVILAVYIVLGCFLEGFAMLVLTLPIFFPIILDQGIDPIWFGVLVVLSLEMGLISPPVGLNVFIVKSVAPNVPLSQIFSGVVLFWVMMLVTLMILVAFPQISALPSQHDDQLRHPMADPNFDVAHLGHVEVLTDRFEESLDFFVRVYGLKLSARDGDSAYLRAWDDYEFHTLKLTAAPTTGVGHVGYRVSSQAALDRRVSAIETSGYKAHGWVEGDLGHGRAFRFEDPFGHLFEVYWETNRYVPPPADAPALKNMSSRFHAQGACPRRLDHLNLLAEDVTAFRDFMQTCLGSRVTEQIRLNNGRLGGCWFTVNNKTYDLACTEEHGRGRNRLHHVTYATDQREDILRAADFFLENGVHIETGPHKHAIQGTFFLYVWEPAGNRVELANAGARLILQPDWEPVTWTEDERKKGQAWGLKTIETFHTHGTPPAAEAT